MATHHPGHYHSDHDHPGHGGHGDGDFPHLHGPPPPPEPGDPGPGIRARLGATYALYLAEAPGQVTIRRAKNPAPDGSFGYVDRFVTVRAAGEAFPRGKLVVGVDAEGLRTVDPETLRIFRWDEEAAGFEVIARSAPGQTRDYVWGELTRPGLYGVVGIDAHPLVARTIGLLGYLEGLIALAPDDLLLPPICQLILCAPEVREAFLDVEALTRLAEDNRRLGLPGPTPPGLGQAAGVALGGGICDTCLNLPKPVIPPALKPWLPELQILPPLCLQPAAHGGRWETRPEPAGVLAVHAALLRTGRVVYFGGSENVQAEHEAGGAEWDHTRVWDPATGVVRTVGSPPGHDLFCCGHALLGNGRLLAAGGTSVWAGVPVGGDPHAHFGHFRGTAAASVFDSGAAATTNPWTSVRRMLFERGTGQGGGRWYPTLVTLADGRVLAMSGHPEDSDTRHNNITVEVFQRTPAPLGVWSDEGDQTLAPDSFPRLHVIPGAAQGEVLCIAMVDGQSWAWNPLTGAWRSLGTGPGAHYASYDTTSVLLPLLPSESHRARVLVANAPQPKILDLGAPTPGWQTTAPRALTGTPWRYHATAVLLADGSVLVVGGLSNPSSNASAILTPERFDPATGAWSTVANASVPRVYHSVALLLPDGRVWAAGSDYGTAGHEMRMEVYSPAYLFRGPRPTISAAPATVAPGATLTAPPTPAASARSPSSAAGRRHTRSTRTSATWASRSLAARPRA